MTIRVKGPREAEEIAAAVGVACTMNERKMAWGADLVRRIRRQIQKDRERRYARKLRRAGVTAV